MTTNSLTKINAFEWQKQFETRTESAKNWVVDAAKELPLRCRREIVSHIKEGMEEASFHRDISYGAKQIRDYLIQDLWLGIEKAADCNLANKTKGQIEDFSIWVATQSPAEQSAIQNVLWDIVPEDIPPAKRKLRAAAMQIG